MNGKISASDIFTHYFLAPKCLPVRAAALRIVINIFLSVCSINTQLIERLTKSARSGQSSTFGKSHIEIETDSEMNRTHGRGRGRKDNKSTPNRSHTGAPNGHRNNKTSSPCSCVCVSVFLISSRASPRGRSGGAGNSALLREDRGKERRKRPIHRARIGKLRPPPPGVGPTTQATRSAVQVLADSYIKNSEGSAAVVSKKGRCGARRLILYFGLA